MFPSYFTLASNYIHYIIDRLTFDLLFALKWRGVAEYQQTLTTSAENCGGIEERRLLDVN